ncbi:unnamed protein product, partial [Rotaria socialis]
MKSLRINEWEYADWCTEEWALKAIYMCTNNLTDLIINQHLPVELLNVLFANKTQLTQIKISAGCEYNSAATFLDDIARNPMLR